MTNGPCFCTEEGSSPLSLSYFSILVHINIKGSSSIIPAISQIYDKMHGLAWNHVFLCIYVYIWLFLFLGFFFCQYFILGFLGVRQTLWKWGVNWIGFYIFECPYFLSGCPHYNKNGHSIPTEPLGHIHIIPFCELTSTNQ